MSGLIEIESFLVRRYRCPFCPRTASRPSRIQEHLTRCWFNADAKGCKTCAHFEGWVDDGDREGCAEGVDLSGRPECKTCDGFGWDPSSDLGIKCPDCRGDGEAVKPGPIVGCPLWKLREVES